MKFRRLISTRWVWPVSGLLFASATAWSGPRITLSWYSDPASGAVGHRILCGFREFDYPYVFDVGDVTRATITLPDGGSEYHLAVIAYNAEGVESPPSEEVIYVPPGPPRLQPEKSSNQFTVRWNSIPGTGYRVLYKPELTANEWNPVSKIIVADATQTEWSTAFNTAAPSAFFKVQVIPNPGSPPELKLTQPNENELRFSWNCIPGRSYQILFKETLAAPDWIPLSPVLLTESTVLEWVTEIDPAAASGFFKLEMLPESERLPVTSITYDENERVQIAWNAIPGCRYQVFCKSDLSETDWTPLSDELVAEAVEMSWTVPEDASQPGVFYAVKELVD